MDYFNYHDGILHAENIAINRLATEVETPFYCYSHNTIERHYKILDNSIKLPKKLICYALKANSNISVIKTLANLGAGADVVSEGEIKRALAAGIPAANIVFSGVGKSRAEMRFAIDVGVGHFNVESKEELQMLQEVAASLQTAVNIALRINPDVDAKTADKISTGRKEDKFGINISEAMPIFAQAKKHANVNLVGVSTHIGSQITSLQPFKDAFVKIIELAKQLRNDGFALEYIDLGGGLGVPYKIGEEVPNPQQYGQLVSEIAADMQDIKFIFEPGRMIMANAGVLVTKVLLVKKTAHRNFIVVDAAMNDLVRPAMYHAEHEIVSVEQQTGDTHKFDIVGPVCETSDVFARNIELAEPQEGDILVLRSAGAYGAVMSSEYNTRRLIAEIMVKDDDYAIIKKPATYEEIIKRDIIAKWQ